MPNAQPKTRDNRAKILDLAIRSMDAGGEASVRVEHIARDAGVTAPVLYHYFGSREGLVVAAQAERYLRQIRADIADFAEAVAACRTADDLRTLFVEWWGRNLTTHADGRWRRWNVIGSAYARPELQATVAEAQRALFAEIAEVLAPCQAQGWLRPDLDLPAAVAWQHGVQLSRAILEHGNSGIDLAAWDEMSLEAFLRLAFGPSD